MVDNGHLFIACADQWLEICELQMAGKKRMDARAFLNGNRDITLFKLG
jgi:methionyl-tRNA formyltransferase